MLDGLIERLADTAAGRQPFELGLVGAGAFPNPARAKVLWAGVGGDTEALAHLAGNLRSAAGRAGTHVEGGDFHPHLTLARIGRPLDVTRWLRVFDLYASDNWQVGGAAVPVPAAAAGRPATPWSSGSRSAAPGRRSSRQPATACRLPAAAGKLRGGCGDCL